jgi:phosphoheptose isomerase
MVEQRIQQQFFESADLQYRAADVLTRPIAEGTAALLAAITSGGKVMVAGAGAGAALAPHASARRWPRWPWASRPCSRCAPWACPATCCSTSTMAKATAAA